MIIVFEGLDGSGKTTAASLLHNELVNAGVDVEIIHWNSFVYSDSDPASSTLFSGALKLRDGEALGPIAYSYLHVADFAHRWERFVVPALNRGAVVIFDRYKFTAYVRDVIRRIPERTVEAMYWFAPNPDLLFYMDVQPSVALKRKLANQKFPSFYESGSDFLNRGRTTPMSLCDAFIEFQSACHLRYESVINIPELVRISAESPQDVVQSQIRKIAFDALNLKR
jgi:dTMP kinase